VKHARSANTRKTAAEIGFKRTVVLLVVINTGF
jgi:hypothetical protein